jgi:hypothetical protein
MRVNNILSTGIFQLPSLLNIILHDLLTHETLSFHVCALNVDTN